MSTLACASSRDQLLASRIKGDKVGHGSTVLCEEGGAVVAHAGLLVDQVRPEVGCEAPLDEEDILAVQGGRSDLPVRGSIHTSRIDNLA